MTFNQNLYTASREALIESGVPWEIAEVASVVVAKDNPHKENLGRSQKDQQAVNEAMKYYWQSQNIEGEP